MFNSVRRYLFSTGSLFTWGQSNGSLGYAVGSQQQVKGVSMPQLVNGFNNNVAQVQMGQNHSALITKDGELYTWGTGNSGQLGHNNDKDYNTPQLVEFFTKNNLKVNQVALGDYHTVALTHDGDVWTWGYGGKEQNFLMDLLFLQVGALGHGDSKNRYTPTPVKALRSLKKIKYIQSGMRFTNAINENNELYVWGKGDYGVFGDGNNKSFNIPQRNEFFEGYLKKELNLSIVKLKSCNNYSVALMSDGNLYGWGSNDFGQMGIKNEIGVEIYETANFPTQVVRDKFGNNKIVDFVVAEDLVAVLLDNNEVYWSGSKAEYSPVRFPLPSGIAKITNIGCCYRCIAVATEDGKLYYRKKFFGEGVEDLSTGIITNDVATVFQNQNAKVLEFGGAYRNRYAIVQI
ncbi:unnamed protein product [Paramecium pentaurelia]|uniref:RCC1-like domain-containing protein n=1 Tax=Paramecium pentaurelia TaxID=43138 RepID=A0A8S1SQK0_9CILI|nr:unnamed protein product [Paramecium pentaurelia]